MIQNDNKELRELINNPLVLITLSNEELKLIDNFLPYSAGFEIECNRLSNFNLKSFESIPDIIDISCDSLEQRFRIPNGTKGLICLYNICEQLKVNSELNDGSGIHYHVDFTDSFSLIRSQDILGNLSSNYNWILNELDTWNYKGTYNRRDCAIDKRVWIRFCSYYKTMEFRIGEMSFDYKVLVERIIHCNSIAKQLKEILGYNDKPKFKAIDRKAILKQFERNKVVDKRIEILNKQLLKYENQEEIKVETDIERIIRERNIKII